MEPRKVSERIEVGEGRRLEDGAVKDGDGSEERLMEDGVSEEGDLDRELLNIDMSI
jgi:hypothetical protein